MTPPSVTVEYIRPGKETNYYTGDLIAENEAGIKTAKHLPDEVAKRITRGLHEGGFITRAQRCEYISKVYFFNEHFNLIQFQDEEQRTLGYYSDIGTPLTRTEHGFRMTDWFLDIWLSPDGTLVELDLDEFEEALHKGLLTPAEAEIARGTFARLIEEAKQGKYPREYLR